MPETLADVDVVILAGGTGSRLAPVTSDVPKVLVPVAGKPFLEHLFDQLRKAGAKTVVLSLGYKAQMFTDHLTAHPPDGLQIKISFERTVLGTGGGLRLAYASLARDLLLVMNGDSFVDADLGAFLAFHKEKKAEVSLLLTRVPDIARFGGVETDELGAVTRFSEKGRAGPGAINSGIYLMERALLRTIPTSRPVSLERETFPSRIGKRFFALAGDFPFIDIGTPESYREAETFFRKRSAP